MSFIVTFRREGQDHKVVLKRDIRRLNGALKVLDEHVESHKEHQQRHGMGQKLTVTPTGVPHEVRFELERVGCPPLVDFIAVERVSGEG